MVFQDQNASAAVTAPGSCPSIPFLLPWEGWTAEQERTVPLIQLSWKNPLQIQTNVPNYHLEWQRPARFCGQRDQSWINKTNRKGLCWFRIMDSKTNLTGSHLKRCWSSAETATQMRLVRMAKLWISPALEVIQNSKWSEIPLAKNHSLFKYNKLARRPFFIIRIEKNGVCSTSA